MSENFTGLTGRQLRVNLSTGSLNVEDIDGKVIEKYLGGAGYGAKVLYDELAAGIDPLGPENKIVFATSPLSVNKVPGGGSITLCFKSPLTHCWGESRCGGDFGPDLKRAGFDHIIIEGKAQAPVYLAVDNGRAELRPAGHLVGKGVSEKTKLMKDAAPEAKTSAICIGVGGENLVSFATVMCGDRAAGRCGAGAVMGSKKLLGIVVSGDCRIEAADERRFKKALQDGFKTIKENPFTPAFREFGTVGDLGANDEDGDLPTQNWRSNSWGRGADLLDYFQENNLEKPMGCYTGCPVCCGRYNKVAGGRYKTPVHEGAEYETMSVFTAYVMNEDVDAAVHCDYLCNELGLDSISCGSLISFAMECYEKGLLQKKTDSTLDLSWGNTEVLPELIREIASRSTPLGKLLAGGVRRAAAEIGGGAEEFAVHVKGLEGPAHDPRSGKALGITYGTASRGMCHIHPLEGMAWDRGKMDWGLTKYGLQDPEQVDRWDEAGKGIAVKLLQDGMILPDILNTCKFMMYAGITLDQWAEMLSGLTGLEFDGKSLLEVGERVINLQRMFNVREGLDRKDDYLPKRAVSLPEYGPYKDEEKCVIGDFDALLDEYYQARGWDVATGTPTREKLEALGLTQTL